MGRQTSNTATAVEVWVSRFAELVLTIAAHQHPLRWDTLEAGPAGLAAIERGMSSELRTVLGELDLTRRRADVWGELLAWAWGRNLDDVEEAAGAIARATEAEVAAWQAPLPEPERREPAWLRDRLARAVRLWHRDLFAAGEAELATRLHADAETKRRLAGEVPASEVVETATNGVVWAPTAATARAVLVPCEVIRPWVDHELAGDAVIFAYPIADAGADRLVRLARVLADENRVAALRLLAEREWTLQELADELGLRKSTVHHHLAQLRAAGLLRVRFNTKSYTLRRRPLEELGAELGAFGRDA